MDSIILQGMKRFWKFVWNDNSIWSWIFNAGLAFVLIKFLVYPGLGLLLQTDHPVVAVVSDSMKYKGDFDEWWKTMGAYYESKNITYSQFREFTMSNGFNKGDIIIIKGKKPGNIMTGDIIVFEASRPEPIIHRVIRAWKTDKYYFSTKGDMNGGQRDEEREISEDRVIGTAWLRVPYVGYVKILFTDIINAIRGA